MTKKMKSGVWILTWKTHVWEYFREISVSAIKIAQVIKDDQLTGKVSLVCGFGDFSPCMLAPLFLR